MAIKHSPLPWSDAPALCNGRGAIVDCDGIQVMTAEQVRPRPRGVDMLRDGNRKLVVMATNHHHRLSFLLQRILDYLPQDHANWLPAEVYEAAQTEMQSLREESR
jgi:hypothetical protein